MFTDYKGQMESFYQNISFGNATRFFKTVTDFKTVGTSHTFLTSREDNKMCRFCRYVDFSVSCIIYRWIVKYYFGFLYSITNRNLELCQTKQHFYKLIIKLSQQNAVFFGVELLFACGVLKCTLWYFVIQVDTDSI